MSALLLLAGLPAGQPAGAGPTAPVLVTFASGDTAGQALGQIPGGALVTPQVVEASLSPAERAAAAALPGVIAVESDGLVTGAAAPAFDDPCMVAVADCLGIGSWYLEDLGIPTLWRETLGAGATIAVLDGGVDGSHPDLAGTLAAPEVDLVGQAPDPSHGTAVAGLALARGGNGVGIVGVAPEASLLSFRVLDAERNGRVSDVAAALVQATDAGADVINLSLVGASSTALESAVAYAQERSVVVVAAAGNGASSEPSFPAALPGVIAVGATTRAGAVADFSNRGSWVDVFAPGITDGSLGLPAPALGGGVRSFGGTSAAAPVVSGLVALLVSHRPELAPFDVERLLRSAATFGPAGEPLVNGPALAREPQILISSPNDPIGSIDAVRLAPGGAHIFGWAIDPDVGAPIEVHAYVGDRSVVGALADRDRPDVAAAQPGYGPAHGYHLVVPLEPGGHVVCAYGINVAEGINRLLGCSTVHIPFVPFGSLDAVRGGPEGVTVRGWAISAATAEPVTVRIEVDGLLVREVPAALPRPDVGAAHVAYGPDHGFEVILPREQAHGRQVCARAVGPRGTRFLGCGHPASPLDARP